jgi:RNA polymerase sigma-70 factor (ECF subfamily)
MNEQTRNSAGSPEEDRTLVKAFQAGDKTAFDTLVLKHKDKVFNLCYWFLGDKQEANDCAQETFIKVYRALKKFRFKSAFFTWLYRIAANTCKNRLKSSEYRREKKMVRLDNPGRTPDQTALQEIRDPLSSPMVELEKKERMLLIQKAIDALPAGQRAVVVLRDIEGLSYEEVSSITGLKLGTVKSKLSRARLELRDRLRGMI